MKPVGNGWRLRPAAVAATAAQHAPRPPGYEALDEPLASSPTLAAALLTLLILLACWLLVSLARMAARRWKERGR
jgi:hypothetical protein